MNEPTLTPEEVVPVPVPIVGSAPSPSAPPVPSSDQLPTVRFQSLPPPLPPARAPAGPAHKTQPLRPIMRDAAVAAAVSAARTARWRTVTRAVLDGARRGALIVFSALRALWGAAWTERRVGVSCAVIGVTMIFGSLVVGWQGVASVRYEKAELASLAATVILARTALAVAAMVVGYGLLRVGERTLRLRSDSDANAR